MYLHLPAVCRIAGKIASGHPHAMWPAAMRSYRTEVPHILGLDHAAVGVKDLERSMRWYKAVLGLQHLFADDPMFNGPIAMLGREDQPLLALLRLPEHEHPLRGSREQRGHFALRTRAADFDAWRRQLPELLQLHRAHEDQSLWLEEQDYGRQRSLFFQDPDTNEIEVVKREDASRPDHVRSMEPGIEEYFRMCSFWDGGTDWVASSGDVRRFRNGKAVLEEAASGASGASAPLIAGPPEDAIEAQSAAAGPAGREAFLDHWAQGVYCCARCQQELYHSSAKWRGPCAWPSFRRATAEEALLMRPVVGYGSYRCAVAELYCRSCRLFLGHRFQDAREKGDCAPDSTGWRH
ncbi:Probable methionine-R-sulfoxide reductase B [Durusdinium trenchii]|uniref:peptide-methionine (R)-S-oxide reductase n=1 Tax=Durusdinium trenchii TaxID=1381693 RepID=A0ABP0RYU4_9DINO